MNDNDPLLVSGMRRWPTGEVRHIPGNGIGMSGTHSASFLVEYDQALAAAYQRGYEDGYRVAAADATTAEAELIDWPRRVALFSNDSWLAQEAHARHVELTGEEPRL